MRGAQVADDRIPSRRKMLPSESIVDRRKAHPESGRKALLPEGFRDMLMCFHAAIIHNQWMVASPQFVVCAPIHVQWMNEP